MKLLWTFACLGGALASFSPQFNSRQLCLPFVPSPDDIEFGITRKLTMDFSIQNEGLYANKHQVYPPSATMQLQATLSKGANQNKHHGKIVELSYSLETETVHENEMGKIADIILVRVEFFDLHGNLVSPHAVAIHLHVSQDGRYEKARFRIEPARSGNQNDHFSQKSQQWVIEYWKSQFGNIFNGIGKTAPVPSSAPATEPSALRGNMKIVSNEVLTGSGSQTQFLPVWPTQAVLKHRPDSGPSRSNLQPMSCFMRIVCYIVLALLGIVIGVMACLVGFLVGHLLVTLGAGIEWRNLLGRRSRIMLLEEGTISEKSSMVSHVYTVDP